MNGFAVDEVEIDNVSFPSSRTSSVSFEHPENAEFSMDVTELGIVRLISPVQLRNLQLIVFQ